MKKVFIVTILFAIFLCGCDNSDSTAPAPFGDVTSESQTVLSDATENTGASTKAVVSTANWDVYVLARNLTDSIENREYRTKVYTKISDINGTETQSISMDLAYTGLTSETPELLATGTIMADEKIMDLQVYYKDGFMYSESGLSRTKDEIEFSGAISKTDVLYSLRNELVFDYVTEINCEYNSDGSKLIILTFQGIINNMLTDGTGKISVSSSGYIISENYSLNAISEGKQISQSADVVLMGYGENMSPITPPDISIY